MPYIPTLPTDQVITPISMVTSATANVTAIDIAIILLYTAVCHSTALCHASIVEHHDGWHCTSLN